MEIKQSREEILEQRLEAMTSDRDSEQKWANEYMDRVVRLERLVVILRRALQAMVNEARLQDPFDGEEGERTLEKARIALEAKE